MTAALEPLLEIHGSAAVCDGLADAGLSGPRAFIRGINGQYDLHIHLAGLVEPLPPANDLRMAYRRAGNECWVMLRRLEWDSAFFGRGMARLDAVARPGRPRDPRADVGFEREALDRVLEQARLREIDYVLALADACDLPMLRLLGSAGFELIETRCHYHRVLDAPPPVRYATRVAVADDVPSLARAARTTINPFDRFHADPAIAPNDAARLMERWVAASVLEGFADVTVVPDEPAPEAFCTARYHREHWDGWGLRLAQPVFSAVAPRHRGWYVRIIGELDEHLRSIGAEHTFLVTQATNVAVVRSWEKLGYRFGKVEHVFRRLL